MESRTARRIDLQRTVRQGWAVLVVALASLVHFTPAEAENKRILGWVERVCLSPEQMIIKAKLDSGANTASLNAIDLHRFEENGDDWVRFKVVDPEEDRKVAFERKVGRIVRIKEHGGGYEERPVVVMKVCLGQVCRDVEVSLTNRTNFNY